MTNKEMAEIRIEGCAVKFQRMNEHLKEAFKSGDVSKCEKMKEIINGDIDATLKLILAPQEKEMGYGM